MYLGPMYSYFAVLRFADQSWEYINRSQILESKNWEQGRTVSFLGIFFADFWYSAFAVHLPLSTNMDKIDTILHYVVDMGDRGVLRSVIKQSVL